MLNCAVIAVKIYYKFIFMIADVVMMIDEL